MKKFLRFLFTKIHRTFKQRKTRRAREKFLRNVTLELIRYTENKITNVIIKSYKE